MWPPTTSFNRDWPCTDKPLCRVSFHNVKHTRCVRLRILRLPFQSFISSSKFATESSDSLILSQLGSFDDVREGSYQLLKMLGKGAEVDQLGTTVEARGFYHSQKFFAKSVMAM